MVMEAIDVFGLRIPEWIPIFVLAGIALVVIAVPLRMAWSATRGLRDRRQKLDDFADRLRGRFGEVAIHRSLLGADSIDFKHEGRAVSVTVHGTKSLVVRLKPEPPLQFPCVIVPCRGFLLPWAMADLRLLARMPMYDPLVDQSVAIYTTPVFGNFLRERIVDALNPEGKPSRIAEDLVVLRSTPGVRRFRLWTVPDGGMTMRLSLRTEDVFYRPDELESLVHHMSQLCRRFDGNDPIDTAPAGQ